MIVDAHDKLSSVQTSKSARRAGMSDIDDAEGRRLAKIAGLNRLSEKQMAEFIAGARTTQNLAKRLPKDLHWSEEPALVYRLDTLRRAPK
jgi:hypothetical protein